MEEAILMIISKSIEETRSLVMQWKKENHSVGFVPTMGFLHEGHESLIIRSAAENSKTVVSIFVNPIQFGPKEDLSSYPRDFEADSAMCKAAGTDLIFFPEAEDMYLSDFCTYVDMDGDLTSRLCGKSRPTHFRGVCTVVSKLFNIIPADRAYFGQKDAQQLAVIRRMVRDLSIAIEIVPCPTVRESDGLAKSSRNSYLSPKERIAARVVSKAIFEGERLIKEGVSKDKALKAMRQIVESEPLAKIDYIELLNLDGPLLGAAAVYIGKTRLIDNFIYER